MHPVDQSLRGRLERRIGLLRDRYAGAMWQRVMHRDLAAHSLAFAAQQVLSNRSRLMTTKSSSSPNSTDVLSIMLVASLLLTE